MRYAGVLMTSTGYLDRPSADFAGQHAWKNRVGKLNQSVSAFQPSEGRYLSLHQTSNVQLNSGVELTTSKSLLHGKSSVGAMKQKVEVQPSQSPTWKAWYEEPISHTIASARSSFGSWENFGLSFVTGMKKSIPEYHSGSGSYSGVAEALPLSQYCYKNYCILPSASQLLDDKSTVVHVEFASGLVVAFYGEKEADRSEKKSIRSSQGEFIDNKVTVPVTGIALYNTTSLTYSVRRYVCVCMMCFTSHRVAITWERCFVDYNIILKQ